MKIYITKVHVILENRVASFQLTEIFHVSTHIFETNQICGAFCFCRLNFLSLKLETFSYAVHLFWNFFLLNVKHFFI
jgi:hypothetical protein